LDFFSQQTHNEKKHVEKTFFTTSITLHTFYERTSLSLSLKKITLFFVKMTMR
jgi:hypothetical protein